MRQLQVDVVIDFKIGGGGGGGGGLDRCSHIYTIAVRLSLALGNNWANASHGKIIYTIKHKTQQNKVCFGIDWLQIREL